MKRKTYKDLIGDGQTPNRYWVSLSNDYSYYQKPGKYSCIDWIGEIIKDFKSKGKTIAKPFKTYRGAKDFCDRLVLGDNNGFNFIVNRINIEDRLTGQLYERTRILNPEKAEIDDDETEDTSFTKDRLKKLDMVFV
jgi:hypothetical protein